MSISVIIPVFNGASFLKEALDSVFKQSIAASEIIVIDDGSTDNSAQIVQAYASKVKYIYQANAGVSAARNLGISLATSEYIAFLDQDDRYLPDKFSDALQLFHAQPDLMVVMAKWRYLFENDQLQSSFIYPEQINLEQYGNLLGACLFKASVFKLVGGFDSDLNGNEDVDLFLRIKNQGLVTAKLAKLSLLHRYHEQNTTKSADFVNNIKSRTLKMLHKSLESRRQNNNL